MVSDHLIFLIEVVFERNRSLKKIFYGAKLRMLWNSLTLSVKRKHLHKS